MGHGVIGAFGGAYAGHKLEDAVKDKRKEKKHRKHRSRDEHRSRRHGSRSSSSSSSSSSSDSDSDKGKKKHRKHKRDKYAVGAGGLAAAGGAYAASSRDGPRGQGGNFSANSSNITLDQDYDLIALCEVRGKKDKLSSIDLNDYLTNEWGQFRWARGGNAFARSDMS